MHTLETAVARIYDMITMIALLCEHRIDDEWRGTNNKNAEPFAFTASSERTASYHTKCTRLNRWDVEKLLLRIYFHKFRIETSCRWIRIRIRRDVSVRWETTVRHQCRRLSLGRNAIKSFHLEFFDVFSENPVEHFAVNLFIDDWPPYTTHIAALRTHGMHKM